MFLFESVYAPMLNVEQIPSWCETVLNYTFVNYASIIRQEITASAFWSDFRHLYKYDG